LEGCNDSGVGNRLPKPVLIVINLA